MKLEEAIKEAEELIMRSDDQSQSDEVTNNSDDKIDTIIMDVPLFMRVLEYAHEDAKNDIDLHYAVQNALELMHSGLSVLSMDNYQDVIKKDESQVIDDEMSNPEEGEFIPVEDGIGSGHMHDVLNASY